METESTLYPQQIVIQQQENEEENEIISPTASLTSSKHHHNLEQEQQQEEEEEEEVIVWKPKPRIRKTKKRVPQVCLEGYVEPSDDDELPRTKSLTVCVENHHSSYFSFLETSV